MNSKALMVAVQHTTRLDPRARWLALLAGLVTALPSPAAAELPTFRDDSLVLRERRPPDASPGQARAPCIIAPRPDATHHALSSRGFDRRLSPASHQSDGLRLVASGRPGAQRTQLEESMLPRRVTTSDNRKWSGINGPSRLSLTGLAWGAAAVGAFLAWLSLWMWVLKRRVALRTADLQRANETLAQLVAERTAELQGSEAALRESGQRLRSLFDDSPVAIWEQDFSALKTRVEALRAAADGGDLREYLAAHPEALAQLAALARIVNINDESPRMFGGATKEDIWKHLQECFDERSLAVFAEKIVALAGGARRFDSEIPIRTRLGEEKFLALRLNLAPGHESTWSRVFVSFIDITQRRQAEQALMDSEARLASIVASTMDAVISIDADQSIILFNAAAEKMFRCPAATAIGTPIDRFIPERLRGRHAGHIRSFGESGVTRRAMGQLGILSGLRIDGTEFPIEASISRAEIGGRRVFTVILRDITERKRAEETLRKSQAQLRLFVEQAPLGIAMLDRDLAYLAASQRWVAEFGRGHSDLIGRRHYEVSPDLPEGWKQAYRDALAGAIRQNDEDRWVGADGTRHWLRWAVHPWIDEEGEIGGVIISAQDITAYKEAEQAQRTRELARRLIEVQEGERRRLAEALHDVASPNLAAIGLNLNRLASQTAAAGEPEPLRERLADTQALLADTAAGIRAVCFDLRPASLDYLGLVPAVESYAEQFARRTGVAVQVRAEGLKKRLQAEQETVLFRIIQEALTNCAKHAGAHAIDVVLEAVEERLRVTISDDGVGFDPDRPGTADRGLGLGLLTMRERAEFAGGRLHIESEPGRGTRIVLEV